MQHLPIRFAPALFLAALLLLPAAPATADSWTVHLGNASLNEDGFDDVRTLGVRRELLSLPMGLAELALEAEIAGTIDRGNVDGGDDWALQSGGAFGTLRTAGPVYLIGRAGLTRQRVSIAGGPTHYATQDAYGLGAGLGVGVMQLELVAHHYGASSDIERITWLTLGLRF